MISDVEIIPRIDYLILYALSSITGSGHVKCMASPIFTFT